MGSTEYLDNLPARRVVNDVGKSEYRVGAKGLKIVEELSARGCSVVTIANALRMGRDAFRRCRDRQPEVLEALSAAGPPSTTSSWATSGSPPMRATSSPTSSS